MANYTTPTWFEKVYVEADAQGTTIPWASLCPSPDLVDWLDAQDIDGNGRSALVVGCGLGDNAEELAQRGFAVTAFDIAPTAIKMRIERFPDSDVTYEVADLFAPSAAWRAGFDFVLEYFNIQALPPFVQQRAMETEHCSLGPQTAVCPQKSKAVQLPIPICFCLFTCCRLLFINGTMHEGFSNVVHRKSSPSL